MPGVYALYYRDRTEGRMIPESMVGREKKGQTGDQTRDSLHLEG
jgi:hypothetical protein